MKIEEAMAAGHRLLDEIKPIDGDNRPETCRNRLRDEGKAYPERGCWECEDWLVSGCPYKSGEELK